MAYSHRTKMVYVPVYDFAMDLQAKKMEWKRGEWYLGAKVITFNAGAGLIKGFDAATGKLTWSKSQSYPATSGMLSGGGTLTVSVGATLTVGNAQTPGSYSGSFNVTVNYQ